MAAGDFTPSKLSELQLKVESVWSDNVKKRIYTPDFGSAQVIMQQQTAKLDQIVNNALDQAVAVKWIDFCSAAVVEETDDDDCAFDGEQGESKSQLYNLDIFLSDSFSHVEEIERGNLFDNEEAIATGILAMERNLVNKFNAKVNAKLTTFGGTNVYAGPGTIGTNNLGYTEVDAANFTAEKLFPYLQQARVMNKFQSLLMLDGGNLFQDNYRAEKNSPNSDGKAALSMYSDLTYRHDLFGFQANALQNVSIVLEPGAVAIGTKSRFPEIPRVIAGKVGETRYRVKSNYLPGVYYDVRYTVVCEGHNIRHIWKYKLRAGIYLNPLRCDPTITGVILLKNKPAA